VQYLISAVQCTCCSRVFRLWLYMVALLLTLTLSLIRTVVNIVVDTVTDTVLQVFSALHDGYRKVPLLGPAMVPPVPVSCVGRAAVKAAMGKLESGYMPKMSVWDILREGQ